MEEMHNYSQEKERAINELREMNKRAQKPYDPTPKNRVLPHNNSISGFALPFSYKQTDTDALVILAILLILLNDTTDMLLFLALIYIIS